MKINLCVYFLTVFIFNIKASDNNFHQIDTINLNDTLYDFNFSSNNDFLTTKLQDIENLTEEIIDDTLRVRRTGANLKLTLKTKRIINLVDTSSGKPDMDFDPNFEKYTYLKKFNNDFWLILGNGASPCAIIYKLINIKDGHEYNISGHPFISPDQKYVITSLMTECIGNYFELCKFEKDKLILLKKIYINDKSSWIDKVGWIDNKSVLIQTTNNRGILKYVAILIK